MRTKKRKSAKPCKVLSQVTRTFGTKNPPPIVWELVTSADAEKLLELDKQAKALPNRRSKGGNIESIVRSMEHGDFKAEYSFDAIVITTAGRIINGRHRLIALSKLPNCKMWHFVWRNAPQDVGEYIDLGVVRRAADVGTMRGQTNSVPRHAHAKMLLKYLVPSSGGKITWPEVDWLEKSSYGPGLKYALDVHTASRPRRADGRKIPGGLDLAPFFAVLAAVYGTVPTATLDQFVDGYLYGSGPLMSGGEISALRDYLQDTCKENGGTPQVEKMDRILATLAKVARRKVDGKQGAKAVFRRFKRK